MGLGVGRLCRKVHGRPRPGEKRTNRIYGAGSSPMAHWACAQRDARGAAIVSYPDPDYHSCGWITSPLRGRGSGQMPNKSRSESARF